MSIFKQSGHGPNHIVMMRSYDKYINTGYTNDPQDTKKTIKAK